MRPNLNPTTINFQALTKAEKKVLRSSIFRHLDGIAVAPTAFALYKKGVLNYLLEHKKISLKTLASEFNANEGYLNVALRLLCSQDWLIQEVDNADNSVWYRINEKSEFAFENAVYYEDVVELIQFSQRFDKRKFKIEPFNKLNSIIEKYKNNYGIEWSEDAVCKSIQQQILKHIEGILVGPTVVALGMGGMFHKYFMEVSFKAEEYHSDAESFSKILDFFTFLDWFDKKEGTYTFTPTGLFFAKRASAYGVTVSYIPTFSKVEELIFGDPTIFWKRPDGSDEIHVDRKMNVWGSGGAHTTYFKKIDDIVIELFNRPIEEQPKGIVDMGCGNGAFLEHLFNVIEQRTARGKMLEEYPLFLVGADYNQAALSVTRANLIQADVWAKVIWGDIGRPDLLAKDLKKDYGIELKDLLNIRTFLDHNRIWEDPDIVNPERVSNSSGGFAFRGRRITPNEAEEGLLQHFKKWAPYVKKFGLLLIELHTVDPLLVAQNLGGTAASAYDATHGFSDQYIVELDVFRSIASEAGLYPVEMHNSQFPNSKLATVSIQLLSEKRE
jgi:hypothetical protein